MAFADQCCSSILVLALSRGHQTLAHPRAAKAASELGAEPEAIVSTMRCCTHAKNGLQGAREAEHERSGNW